MTYPRLVQNQTPIQDSGQTLQDILYFLSLLNSSLSLNRLQIIIHVRLKAIQFIMFSKQLRFSNISIPKFSGKKCNQHSLQLKTDEDKFPLTSHLYISVTVEQFWCLVLVPEDLPIRYRSSYELKTNQFILFKLSYLKFLHILDLAVAVPSLKVLYL